MSDDPDIPYDPTIPRMAGKMIPRNSGTLSRRIKADAGTRRRRAGQMREHGDEAGSARQEHDAAYLERQADRFRNPRQVIGSSLAAGNGGEVVAAEPSADAFQQRVQQPPDMLAAEATEHRMTLTANVSDPALTLALEMSESLGARDALERNLLHQIAASHTVGMALLAKANAFATMAVSWASNERQQLQSIEAARMATAATRVLESAQRGMLIFERLRNGGRQVVTVQHVTVQEGGQAVVAGSVKPGRRRR
jgi:hypothetical protein